MAGKLNDDEPSIGDFANELEKHEHTIPEKWWQSSNKLPTLCMDHPDTSGPAAKAMLDAAFRSGAAIPFSTDTVLGAAVEFGAALASSICNADKQIIVVNPFGVRQSVFYAHPAVIAVRGLAGIRKLD